MIFMIFTLGGGVSLVIAGDPDGWYGIIIGGVIVMMVMLVIRKKNS